jgi:hypothetical protein
MAKWIIYFQRMLKRQEDALKTSSRKVTPATSTKSIKEHAIQFK